MQLKSIPAFAAFLILGAFTAPAADAQAPQPAGVIFENVRIFNGASDTLFDAAVAATQLANRVRWYAPAEVLKMATADNAELLALSGARSPYPGKLGVVEEGALADLLLVGGNSLENIMLVAAPPGRRRRRCRRARRPAGPSWRMPAAGCAARRSGDRVSAGAVGWRVQPYATTTAQPDGARATRTTVHDDQWP